MATFQFGGLVEQVNSVTAAGGTTTLTNTSKQLQVLLASGSNGQTYVTPDATTMKNGQKFEFYNTATGLLTVNKNGGAQLTTVAPSSSVLVKLVDNSTSAGTWVLLANGTAATGGSKNYLSAVTTSQSSTANTGNGNFEQGSTTGWSLAHSALTSNFPSTVGSAGSSFSSAGGAHGGSAASGNLSFSTVSSGQLAGTYSGSYASSAATTAGDMLISDAFNIDTEDQAKVMTFKIYYKAQSGAANGNFSGTSSNSFGIAIYDVTNGAWIMPAGVWGLTQNSGVGYATGTFQTTSNSTQYQIALFNANASSGAITLYVDDISVGPQTAPQGPAMGDWTAYTPTGSWNTNTNYAGYYRRHGDSLDLQIQVNLTGAPNNVTLTVNLPSGLSIDSTKQIAQNANEMYGTVKGVAGGNGFFGSTQLSGNTVLPVYVKDGNTASIMTVAGINATAPYTFANTDFITITAYSIPITGWSSNVTMSADTDTRVVSARMYKAANQTGINTNASFVKINIDTTDTDTHGAFDSTNHKYVVPVTGYYRVMALIGLLGSNVLNNFYTACIYKNGSFYSAGASTYPVATGATSFNVADTIYFNAGDFIELYLYGNGNNSASNVTAVGSNLGLTSTYLSVNRVSGPAVVAATESVVASYNGFTNTGALSSAGGNTIVWSNKDVDTHNAMSSGVFTAPVAGLYSVTSSISTTSSSSGGECENSIQLNGSTVRRAVVPSAPTAAHEVTTACHYVARLKAGDTIQVNARDGFGLSSYNTSTTDNYIHIVRVGN